MGTCDDRFGLIDVLVIRADGITEGMDKAPEAREVGGVMIDMFEPTPDPLGIIDPLNSPPGPITDTMLPLGPTKGDILPTNPPARIPPLKLTMGGPLTTSDVLPTPPYPGIVGIDPIDALDSRGF